MTVILNKDGGREVASKSWPLTGLDTSSFKSGWGMDGIDLYPGIKHSYMQMYRKQPWVHVTVNKLARAIARLPLKSYMIDQTTGERLRVREHPLPRLLRSPFPNGTSFSWVEFCAANVAIYSNALCIKERPGIRSAPVALWPVPWDKVKVEGGAKAPIEAYVIKGTSGDEKVFLPDDVVHLRFFGPDGRVGVSPLEPLRRTLQIEDAAQRYQIAFYRNSGRPPGGFFSDKNLRAHEMQDLREEIQDVYAGPDNAGKPGLFVGGLDYKPFAHTAEESQYIENRKLTREEVAAVFDIPPPMIGILDNATFSNITQQHQMLYQDTLGPWLSMFEETLNTQLVESERDFFDTFVEFDLSEVLRGNMDERSTAYQRLISSGVYTRNEVRRLENLPPVDDRLADSLSVPVNTTPADGAIPSPEGSPVGQPALGGS